MVSGGSLAVVQVLIDAGADVNGNWGIALNLAIAAGRRDLAELLVRHGSDTRKALRETAIKGDFQSFRLLVSLGADLGRQDPKD